MEAAAFSGNWEKFKTFLAAAFSYKYRNELARLSYDGWLERWKP